MKRGEIRWYTFKPPDKRRPVLILTRSPAIRYLNTVTVASITTTVRHVPSELYLTPEDGLPDECAVNFYNIFTVPQSKIGALIAILSPDRLAEVDRLRKAKPRVESVGRQGKSLETGRRCAHGKLAEVASPIPRRLQ